MKKILFIILLFAVIIPSFAQTRRYMCELKGIEKNFSSGLKIIFDFGDSPIYDAWIGLKNKQKFVDEKGNEIEFNSIVDAGNYMINKGWIFLQAYSTIYDGKSMTHWIFYKDAENPEKAIEGIMTKEMYKKSKE